MENTLTGKLGQLIELDSVKEQQQRTRAPRPRAMTTLKLQWLAERLRKAESIKQAVANGTYKVDSMKVARAVLGYEQDEETIKA